ncbi:hypothetical protein IIA79_05725 [bacterium]|nr:hypothetical protein [bacterium]
MRKWLAICRRAAVLSIVWGLAAVLLVRTAESLIAQRRLSQEVSALRSEYDQKLQEYSQLLAEGDRIQNDKQYRIDLLKKRFGYTEPDETPIVIIESGKK